jgi:hypothetical protein
MEFSKFKETSIPDKILGNLVIYIFFFTYITL